MTPQALLNAGLGHWWDSGVAFRLRDAQKQVLSGGTCFKLSHEKLFSFVARRNATAAS